MTLLCFSNYRWDSALQRPQHLLIRFTKQYRVFFIEEPVYHEKNDCYSIRPTEQNVWVITPHLNTSDENKIGRQKKIIDHLIYTQNISEFICWYYALSVSILVEELLEYSPIKFPLLVCLK